MTTIYDNLNDLIQREIIDIIEAGDATAEEFDIDAIADELAIFDDGLGANGSHPDDMWINARGWHIDEDADFWATVARHAR